jgi:hypothetical protein
MWTKRIACFTSFNSLSIRSYNSTCFSLYLCNMSSEASSIAPRTRLMLSSVRVASNYGLLVRFFFLAEGFFGVIVLLCGVTVPIGGSSGGVASPPPCSSSSSSPPPCPSTSSSPPPCPSTLSSPPPGEVDLLSQKFSLHPLRHSLCPRLQPVFSASSSH